MNTNDESYICDLRFWATSGITLCQTRVRVGWRQSLEPHCVSRSSGNCWHGIASTSILVPGRQALACKYVYLLPGMERVKILFLQYSLKPELTSSILWNHPDCSLKQWFLTWVRLNRMGSVSLCQAFGVRPTHGSFCELNRIYACFKEMIYPLITKGSVNAWIKYAGFSTFNKVKNHCSKSTLHCEILIDLI